MKKSFFLIIISSFLFVISVYPQSAEDSVKATIQQLFDGMKNADAKMILSAFADSAILQSIGVNKEGKPAVYTESIQDFAKTISGLKKGSADEQIVIETLKMDGPLAIVWAPYKFYFNGKFSHCGVDSFQLVWVNGVWKIQYLVDTRRRQPCEQ